MSDHGDACPVRAAEVTAAAFRVAPVSPLLGRVISVADGQAGAPPVVVLGYDVWRTRFTSDPGVIGRGVRLGEQQATVVGVMPEDFAFPVAQELWTPLRPEMLDPALREGLTVTIFGRLAAGASMEAVRSELTTLGRRMAADYPETHAHLKPRIAP